MPEGGVGRCASVSTGVPARRHLGASLLHHPVQFPPVPIAVRDHIRERGPDDGHAAIFFDPGHLLQTRRVRRSDHQQHGGFSVRLTRRGRRGHESAAPSAAASPAEPAATPNNPSRTTRRARRSRSCGVAASARTMPGDVARQSRRIRVARADWPRSHERRSKWTGRCAC